MRLNKLLRASVFLIALLFFASCSVTKRANWHLNQATRLNPGLITEHIDTLYIPELEIDTFFSVDTVAIPADIDSILNALSDSCKEEAQIVIREPLIQYVKEREIIKDTLYYVDEIYNDSMALKLLAEVWQDGTSIKLRILLTDAVLYNKDQTVVQVPRKTNYLNIIIAIGIVAIILYLLLKSIKKWLNL